METSNNDLSKQIANFHAAFPQYHEINDNEDNDGEENCYEKNGVYFKSDYDPTEFLIKCFKGKRGEATVNIYIVQNLEGIENPTNGLEIKSDTCYLNLVCELFLFNKYFFPVFNNKMQLYYCNKKYHGEEHPTDFIKSFMNCIDYAIEYGLKKFNVELY